MSIDLFYPDNQNRARRCQQLLDDSTNFQQNITEDSQSLDEKDKNMRSSIDTIMAEQGLETFDELKEKAFSFMDDAQRQAYQDLIDQAKSEGKLSEQMFGASLLVVAVTGSIGLVAKAVDLAATGIIQMGARVMAIGIATLFENVSEGMRILRGVGRTVSAWAEFAEVGTVARVARTIGRIASFVAVVGVVFDGILAIWAAIEGDRQRTELQQGIKDLSVTRYAIKMNQEQAHIAVNYTGEVSMYLRTVAKHGADSAFARELAEEIGSDMKDELAAITDDSVLEDLNNMDKSRGAWTNEDPSAEYIKTTPPPNHEE
eukprot:TRINITY_DN13_c0_g2_i2.p1 TRINITY_DN13_c0_g2~~TRINITY_DN13_c0_g2_i2.p1  ORF type:complete len:332 (+),score=92.31 TRINITY_DN13_c0_g2_i2:51-998(+)